MRISYKVQWHKQLFIGSMAYVGIYLLGYLIITIPTTDVVEGTNTQLYYNNVCFGAVDSKIWRDIGTYTCIIWDSKTIDNHIMPFAYTELYNIIMSRR